jgi:hypothetical protein
MVDAVNAVNDAVRPILNRQKDYAVDWRNLTASEVLEHAGKGEDVPVEILKWAKDYSKLGDVPDDVTYDAAGGLASEDGVSKSLAEGSEISEDEAIDNAENTDDENDGENQVDLYEQGKQLFAQSNSDISTADDMAESSESHATKGEEVAAEAVKKADDVDNQTRQIRQEYDDLVKKVKSNPKEVEPADLIRLGVLSDKLISIGSAAQNVLAQMDLQLQQIDAVFSQYEPIPPVVNQTGTQTVDVGSRLVADEPDNQQKIVTRAAENAGSDAAKAALQEVRMSGWRFIFDRNFRMGLQDIKAGGSALDTSVSSQERLDDSKSRNSVSKTDVAESIGRVEEATFVEGTNIEINNDQTGDKQARGEGNTDKKSQDGSQTKSTTNHTDLNGVKDSTILTDALEIQRRKEIRGEGKQTS